MVLLAAALPLSQPALAAGWEVIRATDFLDTQVVNNDGEVLGEVHELAIDARSGRVHYVVLEVGGFLGINEKLIPYPVSALSPGPGDARVVLDVRPEQLAHAAGFPRDRWPAWTDRVWERADAPRPRCTRLLACSPAIRRSSSRSIHPVQIAASSSTAGRCRPRGLCRSGSAISDKASQCSRCPPPRPASIETAHWRALP